MTENNHPLDATSTDPHIEWFENWKATRALWAGGVSDDESDALLDREEHWARLICNTVAKTPEGMAVQLEYFMKDLAPMFLSEKDGLIDAFNRITEKAFRECRGGAFNGGCRLMDERLKDLNAKELFAFIMLLKAANIGAAPQLQGVRQ